MKLSQLRLSNFQSFGPDATQIELADFTFLIGPNGAGKTAVLQALSRLFDFLPGARRIRKSDFHIPHTESDPEAGGERTLFIEADFLLDELANEASDHPSIPPNFSHLRLVTADGPARIRFRLAASIDENDEIGETFSYVLEVDGAGNPASTATVPKADRSSIQIHYLPARRDPADHIAYTTASLLGRLLRAADWSEEKQEIAEFSKGITDSLDTNQSVAVLDSEITTAWQTLHKGAFFTSPKITFSESEMETVLRHLSISFSPGHGQRTLDFKLLSDGQKSILYLTIVLATHRIGNAVLAGTERTFDVEKLKPPIFTMIAMEEPENSLSPHYLGRVTQALTDFSNINAAQAIIATHAPSILRRVDPTRIRYLRLDETRRSTVRSILLPPIGEEAHKFVREAVEAFPELYFSRMVILGEGDTEEIVLPRVLKASGLGIDESAISVVPLGGRHVNHFWRLLAGLDIPFVTLLDLDLGRFNGGWGRIRYAATQLMAQARSDTTITQANIDSLPRWNDIGANYNPALMQQWFEFLEERGIFFSAPLDLDLLMIEGFAAAYSINPATLRLPEEGRVKTVLGERATHLDKYTVSQQGLFEPYHAIFKIGSKPTAHLSALAQITDEQLAASAPAVLSRLAAAVAESLESIPE